MITLKKIALFAALLLFIKSINAQNPPSESKRPIKNYWSVNGNFGSNLFFGDLNSKDNRWAYGGYISKKLNNNFSVRGQFLMGELYGSDEAIGEYFNMQFYEYNLNLTLNLSNLLFGYNEDRFVTFFGTTGIGLSNWNTERYTLIGDTLIGGNGHTTKDGKYDLENHKYKTGEGIIPIGIGANFKVSKSFDLTIEATGRGINPNSDNIDAYHKDGNVEGYGYTSIGLTYKFGQLPKRVKPPKFEVTPDKDNPIDVASGDDNKTNLPVEIAVISNFPKTTKPNSDFEVKVQINKGDLDGEGTLQQTFPLGFNVEKEAGITGDFTFNDQTARISYEEIAGKPILIATYNISVGDIEAGEYTIPGMFMYMENDEAKVAQFKDKITIIAPAVAVNTDQPDNNNQQSTTDDQNQSQNNQNKQNTGNQQTTDDGASNTAASTTQKPEITKPETTKPETTKPATSTASAGDGLEYRVQVKAIFGGKESSSKIKRDYNLTEPVYENFHNGYTKYSTGSFKTYSEASNHKNYLRSEKNVKDAFVVAFYDGNRLNKLSEATKYAGGNVSSASQSTKPFKSGVEYRIQIGAYSPGNMTPQKISSMYNISETVSEESHAGLTKYTVGSFTSFSEAKNFLQGIKGNVPGAFIVKYTNGQR
jgi:hypothetical protein